MAVLSRELGIDLGTMFIRLVEGGQIVLQEPTIVAVDINEQKIVAVGEEALGMVGRVPEESIEVIRPLQKGDVIGVMGGGCTQAAVMSMNDVVSGETLRVGGLDLDDAIAGYVRRKYGLHVGTRTAGMAKLQIGDAVA